VRALFRADVIALTNPLDLGVIFDFELYARIVEGCLQALSPSAILLIHTYSLTEREGARRLARRVEQIVKDSGKPVAFCVYSQGDEAQTTQDEISLPVFDEIEHAIRGLAASRDWHERRERHAGPSENPATPPPDVQTLLSEPVLAADRALALCQAYGIPVPPSQVAAGAEEAAQAADRLGYPVALKILSTQVTHKSDVGGVALGLSDAAAVRREAQAMLARVAAHAPETRPALMVQRMAGRGLEVILGGKRDHSFGPAIMFGLGGIHVEVLNDVVFRVAPLGRADAEEMLQEVRARRLLEGVRGQPPVDREALIGTILSLSRLMVENPNIDQVDINPLVVSQVGAVAVDARVRLRDSA
jgi:acyl-CoA synthetase (NDP forming)